MPRKTPTRELKDADVATNSPIRRSTRLALNSPKPSSVGKRRSSASETLGKSRRLSFSQENTILEEDANSSSQGSADSNSVKSRKSSAKLSQNEKEENTPPSKLTGRSHSTRSLSISPSANSETIISKPLTRRTSTTNSNKSEENKPLTRSRRLSTDVAQPSTANKNEETKPLTRSRRVSTDSAQSSTSKVEENKPLTRSRRMSVEVTQEENKVVTRGRQTLGLEKEEPKTPGVTTRRRTSVTVEEETKFGAITRRRSSAADKEEESKSPGRKRRSLINQDQEELPETKEDEIVHEATPIKKKRHDEGKTNLDLSIIKETSITEDVDQDIIPSTQDATDKAAEAENSGDDGEQSDVGKTVATEAKMSKSPRKSPRISKTPKSNKTSTSIGKDSVDLNASDIKTPSQHGDQDKQIVVKPSMGEPSMPIRKRDSAYFEPMEVDYVFDDSSVKLDISKKSSEHDLTPSEEEAMLKSDEDDVNNAVKRQNALTKEKNPDSEDEDIEFNFVSVEKTVVESRANMPKRESSPLGRTGTTPRKSSTKSSLANWLNKNGEIAAESSDEEIAVETRKSSVEQKENKENICEVYEVKANQVSPMKRTKLASSPFTKKPGSGKDIALNISDRQSLASDVNLDSKEIEQSGDRSFKSSERVHITVEARDVKPKERGDNSPEPKKETRYYRPSSSPVNVEGVVENLKEQEQEIAVTENNEHEAVIINDDESNEVFTVSDAELSKDATALDDSSQNQKIIQESSELKKSKRTSKVNNEATDSKAFDESGKKSENADVSLSTGSSAGNRDGGEPKIQLLADSGEEDTFELQISETKKRKSTSSNKNDEDENDAECKKRESVKSSPNKVTEDERLSGVGKQKTNRKSLETGGVEHLDKNVNLDINKGKRASTRLSLLKVETNSEFAKETSKKFSQTTKKEEKIDDATQPKQSEDTNIKTKLTGSADGDSQLENESSTNGTSPRKSKRLEKVAQVGENLEVLRPKPQDATKSLKSTEKEAEVNRKDAKRIESQSLDNEKQSLDDEMESLDDEKQSLDDEMESLDDEKQSLDDEMKSLDDEKQSLDDEMKSLDDEKQSLDDEMESLDDEMKSLDDEMESLDDEKQSLDDEMESLDDEKQSLDDEKQSLADKKTSVQAPTLVYLESQESQLQKSKIIDTYPPASAKQKTPKRASTKHSVESVDRVDRQLDHVSQQVDHVGKTIEKTQDLQTKSLNSPARETPKRKSLKIDPKTPMQPDKNILSSSTPKTSTKKDLSKRKSTDQSNVSNQINELEDSSDEEFECPSDTSLPSVTSIRKSKRLNRSFKTNEETADDSKILIELEQKLEQETEDPTTDEDETNHEEETQSSEEGETPSGEEGDGQSSEEGEAQSSLKTGTQSSLKAGTQSSLIAGTQSSVKAGTQLSEKETQSSITSTRKSVKVETQPSVSSARRSNRLKRSSKTNEETDIDHSKTLIESEEKLEQEAEDSTTDEDGTTNHEEETQSRKKAETQPSEKAERQSSDKAETQPSEKAKRQSSDKAETQSSNKGTKLSDKAETQSSDKVETQSSEKKASPAVIPSSSVTSRRSKRRKLSSKTEETDDAKILIKLDQESAEPTSIDDEASLNHQDPANKEASSRPREELDSSDEEFECPADTSLPNVRRKSKRLNRDSKSNEESDVDDSKLLIELEEKLEQESDETTSDETIVNHEEETASSEEEKEAEQQEELDREEQEQEEQEQEIKETLRYPKDISKSNLEKSKVNDLKRKRVDEEDSSDEELTWPETEPLPSSENSENEISYDEYAKSDNSVSTDYEMKSLKLSDESASETENYTWPTFFIHESKPLRKSNKIKLEESVNSKLDNMVSKKLLETDSSDEDYSPKRSDVSDEEDIEEVADEEAAGEETSEDECPFIFSQAEEGEEDTPSEDSNQIIDKSEEINTTESEIDTDDSYEKDSFIVEDEEEELLSGSEYDLEDIPKKKNEKWSRIINVNKLDESEIAVLGNSKSPKLPKKSPNPPKKSRIIKPKDSSSDEEIEFTNVVENQTISVNLANNSPLENSIVIYEGATTPNASISDILETKTSNRKSSSIIIQENINVKDIKDGELSKKIHQVIDFFVSGIKTKGNVSLNVSLDYSENSSSPQIIELNTSTEESEQNTSRREILPRSDPGAGNKIEAAPNWVESSAKKTLTQESQGEKVGERKHKDKKRKSMAYLSEEKPNTKTITFATDESEQNTESLTPKKKKTKKEGKSNVSLNEERSGRTKGANKEANKVGSATKLKTPVKEHTPKKHELKEELEVKKKDKKVKIKSIDNQTDVAAARAATHGKIKPKNKQNERKRTHKVALGESIDNFSSELSDGQKPKKKQKKQTLLKKQLMEQTGSLLNDLIIDVKNRERRTLKPSTSSVNREWNTESVRIVPSKRNVDVIEKGKVTIPKDFKNQMLYSSTRNKRMDTKTLLKKKGMYF